MADSRMALIAQQFPGIHNTVMNNDPMQMQARETRRQRQQATMMQLLMAVKQFQEQQSARQEQSVARTRTSEVADFNQRAAALQARGLAKATSAAAGVRGRMARAEAADAEAAERRKITGEERSEEVRAEGRAAATNANRAADTLEKIRQRGLAEEGGLSESTTNSVFKMAFESAQNQADTASAAAHKEWMDGGRKGPPPPPVPVTEKTFKAEFRRLLSLRKGEGVADVAPDCVKILNPQTGEYSMVGDACPPEEGGQDPEAAEAAAVPNPAELANRGGGLAEQERLSAAGTIGPARPDPEGIQRFLEQMKRAGRGLFPRGLGGLTPTER